MRIPESLRAIGTDGSESLRYKTSTRNKKNNISAPLVGNV